MRSIATTIMIHLPRHNYDRDTFETIPYNIYHSPRYSIINYGATVTLRATRHICSWYPRHWR